MYKEKIVELINIVGTTKGADFINELDTIDNCVKAFTTYVSDTVADTNANDSYQTCLTSMTDVNTIAKNYEKGQIFNVSDDTDAMKNAIKTTVDEYFNERIR